LTQTGVSVTNNIIRSNTVFGYRNNGGSQTFSHNDCHNNGINYSEVTDPTGTNGNISKDPFFANELDHNFTLRVDSACVDAGIDLSLLTDFDGYAVPQGYAVDIGAFEYRALGPPRNFRLIPPTHSSN
jgi:hypothetical protein